MRISTAQFFQQSVNSLSDLGSQVATTQNQISTGRRFLTPGDDPIAASRVAKINQELGTREQYQNNIQAVTNDLQLEESMLTQSVEVLHRVRELTVQAGDPALSQNDRNSLASELDERLNELLSLMNSRSANGDYLFAGFRGDRQPFVRDNAGAIVYQGDEGQRRVQVSASATLATSDSGKRIFLDIPAVANTFTVRAHPDNAAGSNTVIRGAVIDQNSFDQLTPDDLIIEFNALTEVPGIQANFSVRRRSDGRVVDGFENVVYTPGMSINVQGLQLEAFGDPAPGERFFVETSPNQSVVTTIDQLAAGIRQQNAGDVSDVVASALGNLDRAMDSILEARADIGARLNTAESTRNIHDQVAIFSKDVLSQLQDLDYAEAVSRLQMQSFVLEAAQRSFARVSSLSLFNLL